MGYLQHRGGPAAFQPTPLRLRPPLKLLWHFGDIGAEARTDGFSTWVWAGGQHALLCIDENGCERWRYRCEFVSHALVGDEVVAVVTEVLPQQRRFVALDASSGRERWGVPCEHAIDKVLPRQRTFIGSTTVQLGDDRFKFLVASVAFGDQLDVRWVRSTEHDYRDGLCQVAYDSEVACDEKRVFVVRGPDLVALALKTGADDWTAPLTQLGGAPTFQGKSVPMVAEGLVVINTLGGTAAFRVTDGLLSWFFPRVGARTIYDNRVYLVTIDEYYILHLTSGKCLLQAPLSAVVEKKWRLKGVQFSSHLAVSETHGFVGDAHGRLYSFERDSGEPVWKDQPEGITGFSGNIPVIAGNRLYISSFSMAPAPPPRLYCYEGAE